MGTCATGNFDNRAALDMLGAVADVIDPEIEGFLEADDAGVEELDQILACVGSGGSTSSRPD